MKPYPAYKDSGVAWLGEVPAHWEVKRVKYLAEVNRAALTEQTDPAFEFYYIDISNVMLGEISDDIPSIRFENAPSRARRILRKGDTIVSTVRTYLKAIAHFSRDGGNYVASTGFAVLSPKCIGEHYFAYLVMCEKIVDTISSLSVGVSYPAVNASDIANIPVWYPPDIEEQTAIAAYLDRKTAQIDAVIARKERLIELLREERTAVISQAVTKGLNPDAPMKDLGVAWLGEVPERWEVKRLKFAAKINPSRSEIRNLPLDVEVSFFPMEAVGFGELYAGQARLLGDVSSGFTYFRDDDVLIAKITPSFENGKGALAAGLSNGIGFGTTELHVVRPSCELNKHFLLYMTYSHEFRHPGEGMMDGTAGQKRVPSDFLIDYRAAIPPLPDQFAIVEYLD